MITSLLCYCQDVQAQSNREEKYQTKPIRGTFYLTSILHICQGHKRQGKTDELTDSGNMTTKCNVVFLDWIPEEEKDISFFFFLIGL